MKQMLSKHTVEGCFAVDFSFPLPEHRPLPYFLPQIKVLRFKAAALWNKFGEIMCCDFKSHPQPPKYELSATHVYYLLLIMM